MAKGKKTGGRQRGSRNKRNEKFDQLVKASETTPLEYMLSVMRDENATPPSRRDEMAKAAAPYIHSKKATEIELSGQVKIVRLKVPDLNG